MSGNSVAVVAHYREVREELAQAFAERLSDEVRQLARVKWPRVDLPKLRPEQESALESWRSFGRRGQVVMPTGTGKTEVALAAMAEACVATLVVVPIRDLMYQWHRRILRGLGYDAGIVGDQLRNVKPVTVTTYDSAYIHMPELGDRFALVVFDEERLRPPGTEARVPEPRPLRRAVRGRPLIRAREDERAAVEREPDSLSHSEILLECAR